jgi:hypothetical protein
MPKLEFLSNASPSVFGYPPPNEEKKGDKKETVEKAVLEKKKWMLYVFFLGNIGVRKKK